MGLVSTTINIVISILSYIVITRIERYLKKINVYHKTAKYQKIFYFLMPVIFTSIFYLIF